MIDYVDLTPPPAIYCNYEASVPGLDPLPPNKFEDEVHMYDDPTSDLIFEPESTGVGTFLYRFGSYISNSTFRISTLFNFEIAGVPFIMILFSNGFVLYMGWCIVKWVIPT